MSIENIIDYVNETPHNTNISILRNKLELHDKEITKGSVKSVNGILPDEQGNVAIAYNNLEGKPFGEEKLAVYEGTSITTEYEILRTDCSDNWEEINRMVIKGAIVEVFLNCEEY